jgi:hypothetical protein
MWYLLWRYKLLKSSSKEGFSGFFRRRTIRKLPVQLGRKTNYQSNWYDNPTPRKRQVVRAIALVSLHVNVVPPMEVQALKKLFKRRL